MYQKRHKGGSRQGFLVHTLLGIFLDTRVGINKGGTQPSNALFGFALSIQNMCWGPSAQNFKKKKKDLLFWQKQKLTLALRRRILKCFIHDFKQGQQAGCRVSKCLAQQILALKTPGMSWYLGFSETCDYRIALSLSCVHGRPSTSDFSTHSTVATRCHGAASPFPGDGHRFVAGLSGL